MKRISIASILFGAVLANAASAAEPVAPSPQDVNPGVNTSVAPAPSAAAAAPAPSRNAATPPAAAARPGAPAPAPAAAAAKPAKGMDRLQLEATQITGNRELPKVMYVVPWKRPELGDLAGRPANSLLDEVLAPVDRDVFKRQNQYYDALNPAADGGAAATPAAPAAAAPAR